jgi:hypothetical protein
MSTFSEGVAQFGLFRYTCMQMARRRDLLGLPSDVWFSQPLGENRMRRDGNESWVLRRWQQGLK